MNYGRVPDDAMTLLADACPVVGSYGGKDRTLRKEPGLLERVFEANQVPHDIKVYPDAGHSFLNDHPSNEMPPWALVAGKLTAFGYHEASAIDARHRIIAFFNTHLSGRH